MIISEYWNWLLKHKLKSPSSFLSRQTIINFPTFAGMNFLLRLIISTLSVLITSYLLPGVYVDSFLTAVIVAIVIGVLNVLVKPLLILFSLPIVIFSFGLFLIVINTLIILLTHKLVNGFEVKGFWHALMFSIVLSIVTGILNTIKRRDEKAN